MLDAKPRVKLIAAALLEHGSLDARQIHALVDNGFALGCSREMKICLVSEKLGLDLVARRRRDDRP